MRCFISQIGLFDQNNTNHFVLLEPGLNVITGASQKGKSAIIEIFDYCMGSERSTIPIGKITEEAKVFYTSLKFEKFSLLVMREPNSKFCFIKELSTVSENEISIDLMNSSDKLSLGNFKAELARYFNIRFSSIDEEKIIGNASATPSIRSFMSFFLQHQNLIANKHALFYRFEQKQKREQAIDHLKIFMGFVDEDYIRKQRKLSEVKFSIKQIEKDLPSIQEMRRRASEQIKSELSEYLLLTGENLIDMEPSFIVARPKKALERIEDTDLKFEVMGEEFDRVYQTLEDQYSEQLGEIRDLRVKRTQISNSIKYIEKFKNNLHSISTPDSAEISMQNCPFCYSSYISEEVKTETDNLREAINWLNQELSQSIYMRETLQKDLIKTESEIDSKTSVLREISWTIQGIKKDNDNLKKGKSVRELASRSRIKIESLLEILINDNLDAKNENLEKLIEEEKHLTETIRTNHLRRLEEELGDSINKAINRVAKELDFEDFFKPIQAEFDINSFDFWLNTAKEKIYLRSMGSGSNWLFVHLSLFLGLNYVFSKYKNCKIPPILFLDQPSQVFFPDLVNDRNERFDKSDISESDIKHVSHIFKLIAEFCDYTFEETTIRPQIIVMEHADHLELGEKYKFEDFVRKRWRSTNSGLIQENEKPIE